MENTNKTIDKFIKQFGIDGAVKRLDITERYVDMIIKGKKTPAPALVKLMKYNLKYPDGLTK